jgi:hypothetical protein
MIRIELSVLSADAVSLHSGTDEIKTHVFFKNNVAGSSTKTNTKTHNQSCIKNHSMKRYGPLILLLVITLLLAAGCMQSSPVTTSRPELPPTTPGITVPATTTAPEVNVTTRAPVVTVTVIKYIEPPKTWKDTELHFGFSAPQDWKVTTRQLNTHEGSQGLEYRTDLIENDKFYIRTYPVSLNQDQDYRTSFRKWEPTPDESTVIYNNIVFDRFESTQNNQARIAYVTRKSSANDIGFASVILFTTDATHTLERKNFEDVVASFVYFPADKAANMTGDEIPRIR